MAGLIVFGLGSLFSAYSHSPDQPGGDERHVTGPAPDIEYPHARPQPGEPQRMLGVVVIQPALQE